VICFNYNIKASDKLAPRGFEARIVGYTSTFGIYHVMEKSGKMGITKNPIPARYEIGERKPVIGESEPEKELETEKGKSEPVIGESKPENKTGESEPVIGESKPENKTGESEPVIGESEPENKTGESEPVTGESEPKNKTGESEPETKMGESEPVIGESEPKINEPKGGQNTAKRPRRKATDWLDEVGERKSKREQRPTRKASNIIKIAAVSGNNPDHLTDVQTRNSPEAAEWAKARSHE